MYIKEAHPDDGWQLDINLEEGVVYDQPTTVDEREDVCANFIEGEKLTISALVDGMDNAVNLAYKAWPNRLFIVDTDGTAYFSGPRGPTVGEEGLAQALAALF